MSSNPRLPRAELTGVLGTVARRFSEKMFGTVAEPLEVMWPHRKVLTASMSLGRKLDKWDELDAQLKSFAHMAVASLVGCSWCLDLNYFMTHDEGLDEAKASQVPRWRESDVFTPLERDVMAFAEAMSQTPPTVTDEQFASLHDRLGTPAMIELTAVVGFANMSTRTNSTLGIESQGFSAACSLPLAPAPDRVHSPA